MDRTLAIYLPLSYTEKICYKCERIGLVVLLDSVHVVHVAFCLPSKAEKTTAGVKFMHGILTYTKMILHTQSAVIELLQQLNGKLTLNRCKVSYGAA